MVLSSDSKVKLFGIPVGVFSVSLFGLFLGISTTMVYGQLGLFMKNELHATEANVALIDGIVEFIAYATRIFAGVISDVLRERKMILLIGCFFTLFMKPVFAFAQSVFHILFAQSVERIGNGLQASPRDALIADLSDDVDRGKSFGFSKSLKTVGAFTGTLVAMGILYFSENNFRLVFACSAIPVVLAIICLLKLKVNKTQNESPANGANPKRTFVFKKEYLLSLKSDFWKAILFAFIFELAHFSESLFPIFANKFASTTAAVSVSLFISLGQILCSFSIGALSDKFGRGKLLLTCIIMMICANVFFLLANSIYFVYIGAFLWGGQMSAVQGVFLSIISSKVDKNLRGTAIGIYYCAIGVSFLLASTIAGSIWTDFGASWAFTYSIIFCLMAIALKRPLIKGV